MKLLIVHYRGDQGGGAESAIRDQSKALTELGHEVIVTFSDPQVAYTEHQPDIVHFHTIHIGIGLQCLPWFQEEKIPHCISLHDYWPFCIYGRMLLAHLDQPCSAVKGICDGQCKHKPSPEIVKATINKTPTVTFNQYSADIFRRHKIRIDAVIPHSIDIDFFRPDYSKRTPNPSIICVSAWPDQPTKGVHILKQALWRGKVNAKLVHGVSREKVRDELQTAHILVFPSCYEETFGLCIAEGMACGCAVIASNVCGARAQIDHGVTGLLVPPRDVDTLAEAIVELIKHDSQREQLGENAREYAEKNLVLSRMGRDYEQFYKLIIEGVQS